MARYNTTPNIGLKNILIGERNWGTEARENIELLDSILGIVKSGAGIFNVNLYPTHKLFPIIGLSVPVDIKTFFYLSTSDTRFYLPGQFLKATLLISFDDISDIGKDLGINIYMTTGTETTFIGLVYSCLITLQAGVTKVECSFIPTVGVNISQGECGTLGVLFAKGNYDLNGTVNIQELSLTFANCIPSLNVENKYFNINSQDYSDSMTINYDINGNIIQTIEYIDSIPRTTDITYNQNVDIQQIVITFDDIERTEVFSYDTAGNLISMVATEVII